MRLKASMVPRHGERTSPDFNTHHLQSSLIVKSRRSFSSLVKRGESQQEINISSNTKPHQLKPHDNQTRLAFPFVALENAEPICAFTDYLNCTFPFRAPDKSIDDLKIKLKEHLGNEFASLKPRRSGFHGYQNSLWIGGYGGIFAYGGQQGTALISLPSKACALIKNWQDLIQLFKELLGGRITRWDVAADVFDGRPSVDDAVDYYKKGFFNCGGMKPSCTQHGNWVDPDNSGRTFCIGKRKNGKMLRVYEKGKQLGDPKSPWVRWELELHNKDRHIPWDVILHPGKYLAGSYPCMGWVSGTKGRIKTDRKTAQIQYEILIRHLRLGYGKLINLMLEIEGSPEKVIQLLIRNGVPSRLDYRNDLSSLLVSRSKDSGQE